MYCFPFNCCPYLMSCYSGGNIILQEMAKGTVCINNLVFLNNTNTCGYVDCTLGAKCGDNKCDLIETSTCPDDCGGIIRCGDNVCSYTETCHNCPGDCGYCPTESVDKDDDIVPGNCPKNNSCDENAECTLLYNGIEKCKCKIGYVGNGRECYKKVGCEDKENGIYCTKDCCSSYYNCYNHILISNDEFKNTVCFNGSEIWKNDEECNENEINCEINCGDNKCEANENCNNCPSDCGLCINCGDGICSENEDPITCPKDCSIQIPDIPTNSSDDFDNECGKNSVLYDENGIKKCKCKDGYSGNGIDCYLINYPSNYDCSDKSDGIHCYMNNCCNQFYYCAHNRAGIVMNTSQETTCYDGYQINSNDILCKDFSGECGVDGCGDGICMVNEVNNCESDCGIIKCGDNVCSVGENCNSCPNDCGECTITNTPIFTIPGDVQGICTSNYGGCDRNADCIDLGNGKARCICKNGYIGNGAECKKEISCEKDGIYCSISNCCNKYYVCSNGTKSVEMNMPPGSLCYDGEIIFNSDGRCMGFDGKCENSCGNGICELSEDCKSCEEDCGKCIECGDGICSKNEDCYSCILDCGLCRNNAMNEESNENSNSVLSKKSDLYILIGSCCAGFIIIVSLIAVIIIIKKNRTKEFGPEPDVTLY